MDGRTPLMEAALEAADATVAALLAWGAHPDVTDDDGRTALIYAIVSKLFFFKPGGFSENHHFSLKSKI